MYNYNMIITVDSKGEKTYHRLFEAVLGCQENELEKCIDTRSPVISLVGGGGKTTCIMAMASECRQKGIRAVVATTTHMQMPYDAFLLETEDMQAFYKLMEREGQVWLGRRLDPLNEDPKMIRHKSCSLGEEFVSRVCAESGFPVFIEADGARCLPCKVPAGHEPVIVPETTHVLNVYGMDVLGKPFSESVFRPELACAITGKSPTDPVEKEDVLRLAMDVRGGRKCVLPDMHYQVIINKADTALQVEEALDMAHSMIAAGISRVHVTSGLKAMTL